MNNPDNLENGESALDHGESSGRDGCLVGAVAMSRGVHFSHAAHLAFEALRLHVACLMHLEQGGAVLDEDAVADLLARDGDLAEFLQTLADAYGHQYAGAALAAPAPRRASA